MKLPPEIPVITSTVSSARTCRPLLVVTSMSRSVSSTPYENAAARVPPPEKARTTSVAWSSAFADGRSIRYGFAESTWPTGGLIGRVAQPASMASAASSAATPARARRPALPTGAAGR